MNQNSNQHTSTYAMRLHVTDQDAMATIFKLKLKPCIIFECV
jgi:hypothetical protein